MRQFAFGFIIGMLLITILTHIIPRGILGVNNELVKAGLAQYHQTTGKVVWSDRIKGNK